METTCDVLGAPLENMSRQNVKQTTYITGFNILCLHYDQTTDTVTNMLDNRDHAWGWLQVKDYLTLMYL